MKDLTPDQAAAAHAGPDGAFLIAAGPGTGKTFTMVERFRWLVERRLPAERILAVTFTEAAATELRERLADELRRPLEEAWIGTFHGTCARLLREHAYLVGVPREVRVLDELGQRLLVERLQARLRSGAEPGLDRDFEALNPDEVADLVKAGPTFALKLKGRGVAPEEFRRRALEIHARAPGSGHAATAEREAIEILALVYRAYQAWLAEAGRMDFDDLILAVIGALDSVPEFQARCRERFRQILVDEFQDTNRIQLDLIERLAAPGFANVTVVGDAKQSIYGWRDAEIENIRTRFPGPRLPLTVNRRSVQEILDCATAFIRRDPEFVQEPELLAHRGPLGAPAVSVVMAASPRDQAELVAAEIRRLHAEGRRYREVALLAHSVKQLPREFETVLREQRIPFVTVGGSGLFDREEVKDVLALLRLVADPMDDGALVRVVQGPVVRVDDADMYRLASRRPGRRGMRLRDCLEESARQGWPELPAATAARVERALAVTDRLGAARDGLPVADVLNRLLEESGYLRHCQLAARREGPRALMNVRKVCQMAGRFEIDAPLAGVAEFVTHLGRVIETSFPVSEAALEEEDAVRLLTIHGAKGLEFPVVFLVDVRRPNPRDLEKLFYDPDRFGFVMKWWRNDRHPRYVEHLPGDRLLGLARQERRRLVYVAMTRARDLLYVCASRPEDEPAEVNVEADDHFAEILTWALAHPEAARAVKAEQLELPGGVLDGLSRAAGGVDVEAVIARLERLQAMPEAPASALAGGAVRGGAVAPPHPAASAPRHPTPQNPHPATAILRGPRDRESAGTPGPLRLSFSQLHLFELCPLRYRFQELWRIPAPPDELLPPAARTGAGAADLGTSVHRALAAWHASGRRGDLLGLYSGPAEGSEMLAAYLDHPLSAAATLGTELEFHLRLDGGVLVRGLVDRVCESEGRTVLVDYKTNARLDDRLRAAYTAQLRLYGLAAQRGLLPGRDQPRLVLFDLRRSEAIEVSPDAALAESWVQGIAGRVRAEDFTLGPEHRDRPCFLCAYRPLCPDRR